MTNILHITLALLLIVATACSNIDKLPEDSPAPVRADDISNQFVYCINEDSSGQIWIGTFRGLNRFNSREFFQYYSNGDSLSLSDNQVRSILRTRDGNLYVATVQGVNRRTERDLFETIDLGGRYLVGSLAEMADSTIMIEASGKLLSYRPGASAAEVLLDDIAPGRQFSVRMRRCRRQAMDCRRQCCATL